LQHNSHGHTAEKRYNAVFRARANCMTEIRAVSAAEAELDHACPPEEQRNGANQMNDDRGNDEITPEVRALLLMLQVFIQVV
jgi:hypothetical protein